MVNQLTNTQVALMAAAQVHQPTDRGTATPQAVTNTANHFLKWLNDNEVRLPRVQM